MLIEVIARLRRMASGGWGMRIQNGMSCGNKYLEQKYKKQKRQYENKQVRNETEH